MVEISAYKCYDGMIFEDEKKAKEHEDDLLGQELDGLLRLFDLDISRNQEYLALLSVMKKREELLKSVTVITNILNHQRDIHDD